MTGYTIAEVWCDICSERLVAEDEGTLRDHREGLRYDGWVRRRPRGAERERAGLAPNGLIDVCPTCVEEGA